MVENGDGKPYGDLQRYLLGNMPTKIEGNYIVGVFTTDLLQKPQSFVMPKYN